MCACNSESFLREAMESILGQTYRDFEFLIIENGSTDSTWDIIESYADPRIRAFQTSLKQLTFNLNFGLIQTKADYVARMDADDIAEPARIARQVEYLDAHPDVAVLGTVFELFGVCQRRRVVTLPTADRAIRWRLPFSFSICHPTVMFRREVILRTAGYRDGVFCEDLDLWLRLSRDRSVKFANLDEPLLKYRVHPEQVKGRREGYISVASVLFKESLIRRSPLLFAGFILSLFKLAARRRHSSRK
jgi:glycosyltransferase involved in cell wall biosynthesis